MRIQHNIMAMNSYRNYNNNANKLGKNLEKLSSGYRINRAGDDAAGLAISEKMRAQITGLDAAQKNVQDGISLVKTAEGAMQEIQDMLNRMKYLAVQSANGTYENEVDRAALQDEVNALKDEINRIADSANFNGQKLLDGSLSENGAVSASVEDGGKVAYLNDVTVTSNAAVKDKFVAAVTGTEMQLANVGDTATITYLGADGQTYSKSLVATAATQNIEDLINNDAELSALFVADATDHSITSRVAGADTPKILSIMNGTTEVDKDASAGKSVAGADAYVSFDAPSVGDIFTIGDKSYEVVGTAGDAKKGNIEIVGATAAAVVSSLQKNGVTSAFVDANGDVGISDVSQIAVDSKGASVAVDPDAGTVYAEGATKAVYDLDVDTTNGIAQTNGTVGKQTLTLSVIDEKGKALEIEVDYTAAAGVSNSTAIMTALSNSAEVNKYFDVDTANGTLTAKTAGANGAQLAGLKTTDLAVVNTAAGNGTFDFSAKVGEDGKKTLELEDAGTGTTVTVNGTTYEFVNEGQEAAKGNVAVLVGTNANASTKNLANAIKNEGLDVTYRDGTNKIEFADTIAKTSTGGDGGLILQIGDTADEYNQLKVAVEDMHVEALGMDDFDISTLENAQDAEKLVTDSINYVSSVRGRLGAIQNRLEHTANNLSVMEENIQNAESAIRDTDIADEMTAYTKNNILLQSAQAMLAQANQVPQGVLQLLQ